MNEPIFFIGGLSVAGLISLLGMYLKIKSTLHREIVKPSIDAVNSRIDFLENRVEKTEELYDRMQDTLGQKMDKMSDQIVALTEKVAQLSGKLEARNDFQRQDNRVYPNQ